MGVCMRRILPPICGSAVMGSIRALFALSLCVGTAQAQLSRQPDLLFHDSMEDITAVPATDTDAARFLAQSTFGPTLADIQHVRQVGYNAWLNEQFNAIPSSEVAYLKRASNL